VDDQSVALPSPFTETEERIIEARVMGAGIAQIAKSEGITPREVRRVVDLFTEHTLDPSMRKEHLALEVARCDRITRAFTRRALEKCDYRAVNVLFRAIERRCIILGVHSPTRHVLQVIDDTDRKTTSTDRIEAALKELADNRKKKGLVGIEQTMQIEAKIEA